MRCPYCKSTDIWRLSPYPWMRRLRPRFKNRRCSSCGHEFAVWCGFAMRHTTGRKVAFFYVVLMTLLTILLCVDLYRLRARPETSWIHKTVDYVRNGKPFTIPGTQRQEIPDSAPTDLSNF